MRLVLGGLYLRMVQLGSMLETVGSSVKTYFVSELVTSALSIIRRMGAGPGPDREAGVMQMISRLVRLGGRPTLIEGLTYG